MFDFRYPRWAAPFLGALAGALCSLPIPLIIPFIFVEPTGDHAQSLGGWEYALGAGIGLLAGLVILVADPPFKRSKKRALILNEQPPAEHLPNFDPWAGATLARPKPQTESSLLARMFVLIALLLSVMPLIGLGFAVLAFLANRTERIWPRVVSIIALIVSTIFTLIFVGALILAALEEQ